uniref:LAGLIDADG endonuclease n=1 Tax=Powellomyces hirtus TaxID=109895 RepID=A0A4P8NPC3_9FUNG|nr:LAGLIDADG endonuclease [Powellomyces hirtus]
MANGEHLTREGFLQCLIDISTLNRGLPKRILEEYPEIKVPKRVIIDKPNNISPFWITGFTAGDGSFSCSVTDKGLRRIHSQIDPVFCLAQHSRDLPLFESLKEYFSTGTVHTNRDMAFFRVRSINSLLNIIIPFFLSYPFIKGSKADLNFKDFCKIVEIMKDGKHLTDAGKTKILNLRANMNQRRSKTSS